jgi:hypothetical protein
MKQFRFSFLTSKMFEHEPKFKFNIAMSHPFSSHLELGRQLCVGVEC